MKPAPRPCLSCPYRRDVPSGVWSAEEYEKLTAFDYPTYAQPPTVFMCHQQDGRLCAGWVAVHDMEENFGLRIAAPLSRAELEVIWDYTTDVPLFASGAEAAAHGLRDVGQPGPAARAMIEKLSRR